MKNKLKKKRWVPVAILCGIIIAVLAIGGFALTYGNNRPMPQISYSEDILSKLKDAELYGKQMEITTSDFNSLIKLMNIKDLSAGGVKVKETYVIVDQGKLTICAKVRAKGINLMVRTKTKIDYLGDTIRIIPENVKVGLLPIPISIVMNRLSGFSRDSIIITENEIDLQKKVIPIDISDVAISDNKVIVKVIRDPSIAAILKEITENKTPAPSSSSNQSQDLKTNSKSNLINKNDSEKVKNSKKKKILKRTMSQLDAAAAACKTAKERTLIGMAKGVIRKMIANPDYPYMDEAGRLQSYFRSMSNEEMVRLKAAVLNNVDTKPLLQLNAN